MLHHSDLASREEVFTHIDDEVTPHVQMTFAVERIYAQCIEQSLEISLVPVVADAVEYLCKWRGIESARLWSDALDMEKPVIFIKYDRLEGNYLLIDGSHRYVRHGIEGRSHILAYVIEDRAFWEPYLVDGLPAHTLESLLNRSSGL